MAGFFCARRRGFPQALPFSPEMGPSFPHLPGKGRVFVRFFPWEREVFSAGSFPHPAAEKVEKPPLPDSFTQRTHRRNTIAPAIG